MNSSNREIGAEECRKVEALLPALPDGDLTPEQEALVERHLEACAVCLREAEAFRGLSGLLRGDLAPEVSLPTGAQATAWIMERERTARPWWIRLNLAFGAAVAVAAVLVAAFFVPGSVIKGQPPVTTPVFEPSPRTAEMLPDLVVVDDERSGRQVLLAPATRGGM